MNWLIPMWTAIGLLYLIGLFNVVNVVQDGLGDGAGLAVWMAGILLPISLIAGVAYG